MRHCPIILGDVKILQFTHFHQFCFNFIGKDEVFQLFLRFSCFFAFRRSGPHASPSRGSRVSVSSDQHQHKGANTSYNLDSYFPRVANSEPPSRKNYSWQPSGGGAQGDAEQQQQQDSFKSSLPLAETTWNLTSNFNVLAKQASCQSQLTEIPPSRLRVKEAFGSCGTSKQVPLKAGCLFKTNGYRL